MTPGRTNVSIHQLFQTLAKTLESKYPLLIFLTARVGLIHIGVFILLLLSGERNFGVRLNKPYTATVPMDIPVFSGSHADLLVTVFHKIVATGQ